jgi:hypothetical protein
MVNLSMPTEPFSPNVLGERTALMLEAAKLLVDELALLAAQNWEALPDLKKRKVVAASRLRRLRAESEAADGVPSPALEMLIGELETKSRTQIRARLDLIDHQIFALQELSLYLHESLHVTMQPKANGSLGNGGSVG